MYDELVGYG